MGILNLPTALLIRMIGLGRKEKMRVPAIFPNM